MKAKEFKERLAGKIFSVEIIDDIYGHDTSEADPNDKWDRPNTSTTHNVVGFHAAPEYEGKYYDLVVNFEPEFDTTYYVLYAVYSTGDSFGHDEGHDIEYIGFYTEDELGIANENMHKIEKMGPKSDEYSITLRTPNGSMTYDQHTPWIGYFEHLDYCLIDEITRVEAK